MFNLLKNLIILGLLVWGFGWVVGLLLFYIVPASFAGFILLPIVLIFAIFVLLNWVVIATIGEAFSIGIAWVIIAILLDYFVVSKLFNPTNGYYQINVYIYYILLVLLPLIIFSLKSNNNSRR